MFRCLSAVKFSVLRSSDLFFSIRLIHTVSNSEICTYVKPKLVLNLLISLCTENYENKNIFVYSFTVLDISTDVLENYNSTGYILGTGCDGGT